MAFTVPPRSFWCRGMTEAVGIYGIPKRPLKEWAWA